MTGIYKITNLLNGKIYIGKSKYITGRWENHKSHARGTTHNTYIANAMRKHGIENFKIETLEECSYEDLDEREIYWIAFYDSMNRDKGYNQLPGGGHTTISGDMTNEVIEGISAHLREHKLTMKQISNIYGLSEDTISNINVGRRWHRNNIEYPIRKGYVRLPRPDKNELISKLDELDFNETCVFYNTTLNTIKRWCRFYGIPDTKKGFYIWIKDNRQL